MATTNKHIIEAQTKGFRNASKQIKGVNSNLKSMAKAAALAGGAFFGGRALINGLQTVTRLAAAQELAEKKLETALRSTGNAVGMTSIELQKMATQFQRVTRFGDETIMGAQSLLLTFTKIGKDVFPDAIETILNMSEAMGVGLKEQTIQLGKALNDPIQGISALSRVGVQLSDSQKQNIKNFMEMNDIASAQKVILDELEVQFGGMAETAGSETFSGAMDQMKNALGDVGEMIGENLLPYIKGFATVLNGILTNLGFFNVNIHEGSDALRVEKQEVNELTNLLIKYRDNAGMRDYYYDQLVSKAPSVISGIEKEGIAVYSLNKNLEDYNNTMDQRIEKMILEEVIEQAKNEIAMHTIGISKDVRELERWYGKLIKLEPSLSVGAIEDIDLTNLELAAEILDEVSAIDWEATVFTPGLRQGETWGQLLRRDAELFKEATKEFVKYWTAKTPSGGNIAYDVKHKGVIDTRDEMTALYNMVRALVEVGMGDEILLSANVTLDDAINNLNELSQYYGWTNENMDQNNQNFNKKTNEDFEATTVTNLSILQDYVNELNNGIKKWDTSGTLEEQKVNFKKWFDENIVEAEEYAGAYNDVMEELNQKIVDRDRNTNLSKIKEIENGTKNQVELLEEERDLILENYDLYKEDWEEHNIAKWEIKDYYSGLIKTEEDRITANQKSNADARQRILDEEKRAKRDAWNQMIDDMEVLGEANKELFEVWKASAYAMTLVETWESAQSQFKAFSKAYPAPMGQILGGIAATAAVTAGYERAEKIRGTKRKKARAGIDFITDGNELLEVGEGGRERVTVTPLEDVNLEGGGQGITINITGNVLHDSFVEEDIVPAIRESLRLGENMGI